MNEIRYSWDGEWVYVGRLAVYPRPDGTYSIGHPSAPREYRDISTGFENQEAAVDHAIWLNTEEQSR